MFDKWAKTHLWSLTLVLSLALVTVACGENVLTEAPAYEGLEIRVQEIAWSYQLGSHRAGDERVFISLYIIGVNTDKSEKTVNPMDFRLIDGSGETYGGTLIVSREPPFSLCGVGPGETCAGWWTARVPDRPDVKEDLRLQWQPDWPSSPVFEVVLEVSERRVIEPRRYCSLQRGEKVHVRENTRTWAQPNVVNATPVAKLSEGKSFYIVGGPEWGRIRQDIDHSGWWWQISKTRNGKSMGWIWEGRIGECYYKLD